MGFLLPFDIKGIIFKVNCFHSEICFKIRVIAFNFVVANQPKRNVSLGNILSVLLHNTSTLIIMLLQNTLNIIEISAVQV